MAAGYFAAAEDSEGAECQNQVEAFCKDLKGVVAVAKADPKEACQSQAEALAAESNRAASTLAFHSPRLGDSPREEAPCWVGEACH